MLHDIQRKAGSLNRGSLPLGFLLALIGSEKESNDLCAGAAIVRPNSPSPMPFVTPFSTAHATALSLVAIGKNIAELCLAIDQLTNGTEQESHALGTGAGGVRTEFAIARSCGDTVLHRPRNCLSIIAVRRNIREAAHALGFGRTGSTPQEGDDLCAGAGLVRSKEAVANTAGDALLGGPTSQPHSSRPSVETSAKFSVSISANSAETVTLEAGMVKVNLPLPLSVTSTVLPFASVIVSLSSL